MLLVAYHINSKIIQLNFPTTHRSPVKTWTTFSVGKMSSIYVFWVAYILHSNYRITGWNSVNCHNWNDFLSIFNGIRMWISMWIHCWKHLNWRKLRLIRLELVRKNLLCLLKINTFHRNPSLGVRWLITINTNVSENGGVRPHTYVESKQTREITVDTDNSTFRLLFSTVISYLIEEHTYTK